MQTKWGMFSFQPAHYLILQTRLIFHEDKTQTSAHINFSSPSTHISATVSKQQRGEASSPLAAFCPRCVKVLYRLI